MIMKIYIQVAFRSTKVDLFSSAPSNVATVPGSVLERSDVGDAVSYLVQLQDGSKITATLLPEEDKKVWCVPSALLRKIFRFFWSCFEHFSWVIDYFLFLSFLFCFISQGNHG